MSLCLATSTRSTNVPSSKLRAADKRGRFKGPLLVLALVLLTVAMPATARAGYGVQPNGQTISVQLDQFGYVASPRYVEVIVYLDGLDYDPWVWVSDSPAFSSFGTPLGTSVGVCGPYSLRTWIEPNKYVCSVDTLLLQPNRTYFWWMAFRRRDTANFSGQQRISGPFAFALRPLAPPPQATPTPPAAPPAPVDEPEFEPEAPASSATFARAARLPSRAAFDGSRSIKHTKLTDVIYKTLKLAARPRVLAVACWSEFDYEAVAESAGIGGVRNGSLELAGFWLAFQPRWLHLAPWVCEGVQGLFDSRSPNAKRASSLRTALHEAIHAHGIRNEAETNCYAVQLVPYAGVYMGLRWKQADYLRKLALNITRRMAPPGYWNATNCRDGGPWDLVRAINLR